MKDMHHVEGQAWELQPRKSRRKTQDCPLLYDTAPLSVTEIHVLVASQDV